MQRAGQQSPVSFGAAAERLSEVRHSIAVRLFDVPAAARETAELPAASDDKPSPTAVERKFLEVAIEERIQSRLQGRVRNLRVEVRGDVVTLQGQCATYYTKQLAQHAAMGVLEDEHLENAIVVGMGQ